MPSTAASSCSKSASMLCSVGSCIPAAAFGESPATDPRSGSGSRLGSRAMDLHPTRLCNTQDISLTATKI